MVLAKDRFAHAWLGANEKLEGEWGVCRKEEMMSRKERGNRGRTWGKDDLDELKQMNKQKLKTKKTNIDTSKHININLEYRTNNKMFHFRPFYLHRDKVKTQENYLWCVLNLKLCIGNPML